MSKVSYPQYVALDTNVFILLCSLHNHKSDQFYHGHYHLKQVMIFYEKLIEEGGIVPVIVPAVFQELRKYEQKNQCPIFKQLKKYNCQLPIINLSCDREEKNAYVKEFMALADKYSKPTELSVDYLQKTKNGKYCKKRPFKMFNDYATGENIVAMDAIIMAQTTLLGIPIVSNDKHFISNNTPLYIQQINMENGYSNMSIPYSPEEYLMYYKTLRKTNHQTQEEIGLGR